MTSDDTSVRTCAALDAAILADQIHGWGVTLPIASDADYRAGAEQIASAITADRDRAVAEATNGAVQGERFAAAICRLVGARETGTGGQTVDACTASLYANAAKRIERMIARDKARPTPDEARRLVTEHRVTVDALAAHCVKEYPKAAETFRLGKLRDDSEAALLRALGVEA